MKPAATALKVAFIIFFVFEQPRVQAQDKYWIFFRDKPAAVAGVQQVSQKTLSNRAQLHLETSQWGDLPLNGRYLAFLSQHHIYIQCTSKWLNAVSARLTPAQIRMLRDEKFVTALQPIRHHLYTASLTTPDDGGNENPWLRAFTVMDAQLMVENHLTAKDVKIGVIDAGFKDAQNDPYLKNLIQANQVVAMHDFVRPSTTNLLNPREANADDHGKYVLQMLGGSNDAAHLQYGLATGAKFYLARTDDSNREFRGEEDYWVRALEWLDSMGVRLVNSSLGYSRDFDDSTENYSPADMNGHTSLIARAAQAAIEKRGMIIVTSAGNEGKDSSWLVITTPSDAPGVISVGAAGIDYWDKPGYSSIGPATLPYVRPTVACPTAKGTSFSAPFITGLIGCMLERKPDLTSKEIMELLQKAGHLYPYPNNYLGYGLPTVDRVLSLLQDPAVDFHRSEEIIATGDSVEVDLNRIRQTPGEVLTFFFKKNKYEVAFQAISSDDRIVLHRKKTIGCITIASHKKVVEVIWK